MKKTQSRSDKLVKKCFKCKKILPISEFYKHKEMADGYIGKCKTCTRADVRNNYRKNKINYAAYELIRNKRPERKVQKLRYSRERRIKSPDKYAANNAVANAKRSGRLKMKPCEVCGLVNSQAHHDDYSKPLDVRWLCFKHHRELHGQQIS